MKTRLREMRPADVPAVLERLKEQNERDGTSYALPQVFDAEGCRLAHVPLALVAVDAETGEVRQGHVYEATLEGMTFGIDAQATACSLREHPGVFYLLRERGFKDLHTLVPEERVAEMEHGLTRKLGMIDTGKRLRHFYRLLDPAENERLRQWYEDGEAQR